MGKVHVWHFSSLSVKNWCKKQNPVAPLLPLSYTVNVVCTMKHKNTSASQSCIAHNLSVQRYSCLSLCDFSFYLSPYSSSQQSVRIQSSSPVMPSTHMGKDGVLSSSLCKVTISAQTHVPVSSSLHTTKTCINPPITLALENSLYCCYLLHLYLLNYSLLNPQSPQTHQSWRCEKWRIVVWICAGHRDLMETVSLRPMILSIRTRQVSKQYTPQFTTKEDRKWIQQWDEKAKLLPCLFLFLKHYRMMMHCQLTVKIQIPAFLKNFTVFHRKIGGKK